MTDDPNWETSDTQPKGEVRPSHRIPEKALERMKWYWDYFRRAARQGNRVTSSQEIGQALGLKSSLVRRDLSYFGELGTARGYQPSYLSHRIAQIFRGGAPIPILWIGVEGFLSRPGVVSLVQREGYVIRAILDAPEKAGGSAQGFPIHSIADLEQVVRREQAQLAILASEEDRAAAYLERCAQAGIQGVLNLTTVHLAAPAGVHLRQVDITTDLFVLSYLYQSQR